MPDLTALGKYLGGGLSFGAFGGKAELMDRFDPARPDGFFHAGTFNNDVLTMAAGLAGLSEVLSPAAIAALNARGDALRDRLNALVADRGLAMTFSGLGSIMALHFRPGPITDPRQSEDEDPRLKRLFHLAMLERGIYLTPRGMIVLSLPMGDPEIAALTSAVEDYLDEYGPLLSAG